MKPCAKQTINTSRNSCADTDRKERKKEKGKGNLSGLTRIGFAFLHFTFALVNAMPQSTRNIGLSQLRVGLLVLIAIAVLVLLILNASGTLNPFASHIHLRARFGDASGLREGSEVRLAGVRIGKVDRIRLLSPNEVGTGPNPQKIE